MKKNIHKLGTTALAIFLATFSLTLSFSVFAKNTQKQDIDLLEDFYQNPVQVMQKHPEKTDVYTGKKLKSGKHYFLTKKQIEEKEFVKFKNEHRSSSRYALKERYETTKKKMKELSQKIRHHFIESDSDHDNSNESDSSYTEKSAIIPQSFSSGSVDDAAFLIDRPNQIIRNIRTMNDRGLDQANVAVQPWSDDYWAIRYGLTGYRYADPRTPEGGSWKSQFRHHKRKVTASSLIRKGKSILLSPSEKIDYVMNLTKSRSNLTSKQWNEGEYYYKQHGEVEKWMGQCHGWAVASYMLPRPTRMVHAKTLKGDNVSFYPSDIKAMGSLLWANNSTKGITKFVGGRCNTKDPSKDRSSGRIIDQDCFDTNPGTWHMAIVNQIGQWQRSFVMDATFDYEVWNHPVVAYKISYFNPETGISGQGLKDTIIPREHFRRDLFSKYRSNEYTNIVGVEMDVDYVVETVPTTRENDDPSYDILKRVTYRYDIELDRDGNILGGEWYTNVHPDFMWTVEENAVARSSFDHLIQGSWDIHSRPSSNWRTYAKQAASYGQPLGVLVESLFEEAK